MVCAVSVGDNCTCSTVRQPSSGAHPLSSTSMPQGTTFAIPVQLHCTTSTPVPMNKIVMESSTDSNMWLHFFIAVAKVRISEDNTKQKTLFCFYCRAKVPSTKSKVTRLYFYNVFPIKTLKMFNYSTSATTSISTKAPFGKVLTATAERAG